MQVLIISADEIDDAAWQECVALGARTRLTKPMEMRHLQAYLAEVGAP